jgi:hypothetical protein
MHLSIPLAAGTETRGGVPRRHILANAGVSYADRMYDDSSVAALLVVVYGASSGAPWARRKEAWNAQASRHVTRGSGYM